MTMMGMLTMMAAVDDDDDAEDDDEDGDDDDEDDGIDEAKASRTMSEKQKARAEQMATCRAKGRGQNKCQHVMQRGRRQRRQ